MSGRLKSIVPGSLRNSRLRRARPGAPVTLGRYLDAFDLQPYDPAVQATKTNFLAELERVIRGEPTTVDPRALLFVAAEVILEAQC